MSDSGYLCLAVIHDQLFSGSSTSSGTNWGLSLNQWIAKEEIQHHEAVEAWIKFGLNRVSDVGIVLEKMAAATPGGPLAAMVVSGLFSITPAVVLSQMAHEKSDFMGAARQSYIKPGTEMVHKEQIGKAEAEARSADFKLKVAVLLWLTSQMGAAFKPLASEERLTVKDLAKDFSKEKAEEEMQDKLIDWGYEQYQKRKGKQGN